MNALQSLSTGNEEEAFNVTALLRSTHEVETRVQEIYRCFSLLSTFAAHELGIASEVLQGNSITRNECHNVHAAFQQHLSDYGGALHALNPCTASCTCLTMASAQVVEAVEAGCQRGLGDPWPLQGSLPSFSSTAG